MEENKKSNGLVVPFIITIILLIGLVGYICYDKFLKNDIKNNQSEKKVNNRTIISSIDELPQELNRDIIKISPIGDLLKEGLLNTNIKDYKASSNNIDFTFNCINYKNDENDLFYDCSKVKVSFNNINYIDDFTDLGCGHSIDVLLYKDYIILLYENACNGATKFGIYNKLGKLLYATYDNNEDIDLYNTVVDSLKYSYIMTDDSDYNTFNIVDDILYYAEEITVDSSISFKIKYIDLSSSQLESKDTGIIVEGS